MSNWVSAQNGKLWKCVTATYRTSIWDLKLNLVTNLDWSIKVGFFYLQCNSTFECIICQQSSNQLYDSRGKKYTQMNKWSVKHTQYCRVKHHTKLLMYIETSYKWLKSEKWFEWMNSEKSWINEEWNILMNEGWKIIWMKDERSYEWRVKEHMNEGWKSIWMKSERAYEWRVKEHMNEEWNIIWMKSEISYEWMNAEWN